MKTASEIVRGMNLPGYVHTIMSPSVAYHPQRRTEAFHRFYGAPIRDEAPDATFSHMDDQRVAFRAAFILSEAIELLEKGLGLRVDIQVNGNGGLIHRAYGSGNGGLTTAIMGAMQDGGKRDVVELVDALGDLNVVVNGFAVELGVDMVKVDREVSASNFTKAGEDGQPLISDGTDGHPKGKVLKGPNFIEPQIASVIGLQTSRMGES